MTERTYTQQEIESTVADIERVGKIEQAPKAAAMLRQLLAERRATLDTFDAIAREVCAAIGIEKTERPAHWILGIRDMHKELADLRAYRQRREAEDKADHIGDANKMVPAAGKVLTEAQAVALATRAAEIAAEAAIDVVMDRNVFAINTIAEYIKRGEYDNRTKSKTAMEREFVIAAAAVGRAWGERT